MSYTYNGAAGFYDDFPTDIAYDPFKNQVLIAGYKTIIPQNMLSF